MISKSVTNFYNKENDAEYYKKYEREHAPRLDFVVKYFKLDEIKNKIVADFGCGYGFLLNRLNKSNLKYGFDGANIDVKNTDILFVQMDFDQISRFHYSLQGKIDVSFCFETLEHIANPYNLLCRMKEITVPNGYIYVSIPDEQVGHNVVYPGLMFPHINFEEFLYQMALPIEHAVRFNGDWPARIWRVRNAPWREKKLKYPKEEPKFRDASPLECTNI